MNRDAVSRGPGVWFGVLGVLDIQHAGAALPVSAGKQRALLAARPAPTSISAVSLVPVLLGDGIPFFAHLGTTPIRLGEPRITQGSGVTHLLFTVGR